MNKLPSFILTCCFLIHSVLIFCQNQDASLNVETVRKGVIYKKEKSMDFAIHTNGYYLGWNKGKIKTYYKTSFLHIDFGLVKHPKQSKLYSHSGQTFQPLSSYVYAKQNSFWNLRIGRGLIRYYSEKARHKGLAMGLIMEGGLSLGILKPYYLKVEEEKDGRRIFSEVKYSNENEHLFLDQEHINGASKFWKGIGESKFVPGAHGKLGVHFDPGAFEKFVRAIDAGFQLDVYPSRVPILISTRNPFIFLNLYLNLQLGKRS